MSRAIRRLVVTTVATIVVGFVPVGVLIAWWYFPVPRRWWSFAIMMVTYWLSAATAFVGHRRVRRLRREVEAERVLQRHADHIA